MSKENIIIGGGISGLIFKLYNPEFLLLSDDFGGLLKYEDTYGNMILWDTKETRELLEDLGIPIISKKERIYYFFNGKIYDEAPEIIRADYLTKKMGSLSKKISYSDLSLSTKELNYFDSLQVNWKEMLSKLVDRANSYGKIDGGTVSEITNDEIIFIDSNSKLSKYKYSTLISTIPAFKFWEIWKGNCQVTKKPSDFEFLNTTYISIEKLTTTLRKKIVEQGKLPEDFSYSIYFLDDSPYHRITRTSTGLYSIQFSDKVKLEDAKKIIGLGEKEVFNYRVENIGQFVSQYDNFPPDNICFLGRHSLWQHHIKIQDIIGFSKFSKFIFYFIKARQSRFNTHFMNFNNLTLKDKQILTEKWVLYLNGELNEFLRETNWKLHRPNKEIDRKKIVTEYVDLFKFFLGLGDIWNISIEELSNVFNEKSNIVEQRFLEEFNK